MKLHGLNTGHAHGIDSRAVPASAARELRESSVGDPRSSRGWRHLRSEHGQSAVEFAMVVPMLSLIIIAILHFGKVMNYWLDLNHVASEGARKAAVNWCGRDDPPCDDGDYDTYLRPRLETGELRTGGTTSIQDPATIAVCLPEGSDVGDPVTVQVAAEYSMPFIGASITLRGTATMRMEQAADFSGAGACV